jgi:hypothetical protein
MLESQDEWIQRLETTNREIRELEERLKILKQARRNINNKIHDNIGNGGAGSDSYVVSCEQLKPIIERILSEYGVGGQRLLARRSGIASRTIRAITNGYRETTTLRTADALLTAAGLTHLIHDLDIKPYKSSTPLTKALEYDKVVHPSDPH